MCYTCDLTAAARDRRWDAVTKISAYLAAMHALGQSTTTCPALTLTAP